MIIFMSDILCVTNRKLCKGEFLCRIEKIARTRPCGIILREKDLSEEEYKALAASVTEICKRYKVLCILHRFVAVAETLCADAIHLPLPVLREMTEEQKKSFSVIGASCHSVEEAVEAEKLGCTYLVAGHVFDTACKKGLPGRGADFLKAVCACVSVPVYGIGGINKTNYATVCQAGAKGVCIMSGLMECENVEVWMEEFRHEA